MQTRQNSPLTEGEVLFFFVQLLLALEHVHAKQILHRDLKSQNVLLDRSHQVIKLSDFGISKLLLSKSKVSETPRIWIVVISKVDDLLHFLGLLHRGDPVLHQPRTLRREALQPQRRCVVAWLHYLRTVFGPQSFRGLLLTRPHPQDHARSFSSAWTRPLLSPAAPADCLDALRGSRPAAQRSATAQVNGVDRAVT